MKDHSKPRNVNYDYKEIASEYDDLVRQYQWQAPKLIFDYLSKFALNNSKLLDIGVGTGISSQGFSHLGIELYGLDNSPDLLDVCKAKNVFKELHLFDILKDKIPYPNATFDVIICSGVFHFFSSLDQIFKEIARVIKHDGLFAFTFFENHKDSKPYITKLSDGVSVYYHSKKYLENLQNELSFVIVNEQTFTTIKDLDTKETLENKLFICRKT